MTFARSPILFLLLAACVTTTLPRKRPKQPKTPKVDEPDSAEKPVVLPKGFVVRETHPGENPFLPPEQAWRQLISKLTTLQADTRRRGQSVLLSFGADRVLITTKEGIQTAWRLPEGLELTAEVGHVVICDDLSLEVYGLDGSQVQPVEELTVARGKVGSEGEDVQEFRMVIKGNEAFRSMTSR